MMVGFVSPVNNNKKKGLNLQCKLHSTFGSTFLGDIDPSYCSKTCEYSVQLEKSIAKSCKLP